MGQEQLQGPDDLVLDQVDADDVGQPYVDLLRPDHRVRRLAGDEELGRQQQDQGAEEQGGEEHQGVDRRQPEQVERAAVDDAVPEERGGQPDPQDQPQQPRPAQLLAAAADVGAALGVAQVQDS